MLLQAVPVTDVVNLVRTVASIFIVGVLIIPSIKKTGGNYLVTAGCMKKHD